MPHTLIDAIGRSGPPTPPPVAAGWAMLGASGAPPLVKAAVHYRDAAPPGGEACGTCRFFQSGEGGAAGACAMVVGEVLPAGRCAVWTRERPARRRGA